MLINPAQVKNILVVRNDRFGEFILNIPALRALKETYPQARIIAMVSAPVKSLAECVSYIDEVIVWNQVKHSLGEKYRLLRLLKSRKPEIAAMLNPSQELNILTYLTGIPIRVGYDRKWGFLLTHKTKDLKHLGQKHEIEYNLELVSLAQAKTCDKTLSLRIGNDIIGDILKEYNLEDCLNCVALHPWASDPIKRWEAGNFLKLARRIIGELNIKVILVGGAENVSQSQDLFNDLGPNFVNLTGKVSLVQLAALLKKCRVIITGDSGPMHLACAVGTPVVAIFRNDLSGKSPKRWGPWGKGNIIIAKKNLSEITVDEVFHEVGTVLNSKLKCPLKRDTL